MSSKSKRIELLITRLEKIYILEKKIKTEIRSLQNENKEKKK